MATLKLKSNILDLVCRICLKMNKKRFNIFEHIENNKSIPDMIMECTDIKVQKDDGFPITICINCLEKLNSLSDFKAMAIESDTKLHKFYLNKSIENDLPSNNISNIVLIVKEEDPVIKCERNDSLIDPNDHSQEKPSCIGVSQDVILEKENIIIKNIIEQYNQISNLPNKTNYKDTNLIQNNTLQIYKDISNQQKKCMISEDTREQRDYFIENGTMQQINFSAVNVSVNNGDTKLRAEDNLSDRSSDISDESSDESDQLSDSITSSNELDQSKNDDCESECSVQIPSQLQTKKEVETNLLEGGEENSFDDPFGISEYYNIIKQYSNLSKKDKAKKTLYCKQCKRSFGYYYYLQVHIRQHTGNTPYKCEVCSKCFVNKSSLKQHQPSHTSNKPYSCEICGKQFKFLSGFNSHKVTHSEERPHKCTVCDKSFKREAILKNHMLTHKNIRTFVCEVCGKAFATHNSLHKHRSSHNIEKKFTCPKCGKGFKDKRLMRAHLKLHSDEKPFVCSYCGKRFHSSGVRKNHILIHTGAKPHSCEICGKKFRQRNCIVRHMRIHTGETPFSCKLCPFKFKYTHHLQNHIRVHHRDSPKD